MSSSATKRISRSRIRKSSHNDRHSDTIALKGPPISEKTIQHINASKTISLLPSFDMFFLFPSSFFDKKVAVFITKTNNRIHLSQLSPIPNRTTSRIR